MRSKEVEEAIQNLNKDILVDECWKNHDIDEIFKEHHILSLKTVLSYIEELEKDVKDAMDGYNDLGKDLAFNFVSKEDIRDKIKELENRAKEYGYYKTEIEYARNTLQEIIGEEVYE